MPSKTHPSNRHHIHNFMDCRELLEQRGFTFSPDLSYEDETEAVANSVETTTGTLTPKVAYRVALNKRTKALTVTDNTQ